MATKKKMAKKTVSYVRTRADIAEQLNVICDRLDEIDTVDTSPSDVMSTLSELSAELNDVRYDLQNQN